MARALVLALVWAALVSIQLDRPAFLDYEGRYAEVAREMRQTGDWVTPRLDHTLFLNKPPLLYWTTALAFRAGGETEWARLLSVLAAALTLLATCRLGARLYGEATGLAGGLFLATMLGFVLEARKLRPDSLLLAAIAVAVLAWHVADAEARPARRAAWLAAMWAALGVGIMTKGLVALVVAGLPIGAAALRDHGWRALGRVRPGLGVAVLAALVLPWHVLVSGRHPGFAWDYVVNQHLLFFLDRKLPRDSEGVSLLAFWGAFAGRAFPWVLLAPLALREALGGLRRGARGAAAGSGALAAWALGLLLFFSLAPSRLEHYSVPALPAVALLAARGLVRLRAGEVGRGAWAYLGAAAAGLAVGGVLVAARLPGLLARIRFTAEASGLLPLVLLAGATLAGLGIALGVAVLARRANGVAAALGLGAATLAPIVVGAEATFEPLLSWKPVAALLAARAPAGAEIVFEAPEEYQLVGGLAFYTGRRILLLEPPGFVPPTYLAGRLGEVFLSRAEFERRWRGGAPVVFVTNLQRWRDDPTLLVAGPAAVLGRSGYRWVVVNRR